jgi:hypothetical protein
MRHTIHQLLARMIEQHDAASTGRRMNPGERDKRWQCRCRLLRIQRWLAPAAPLRRR